MAVELAASITIEPMRPSDIPIIQTIERDIFPAPWPANAYQRELAQNKHACYLVMRNELHIVGYGGIWRVGREAHVTTIGVRASQQRRGYGRILFAALVVRAWALGAHWITLEARATNEAALRMYDTFGFKTIGRRRGYYTDNGEDAIIMWSDNMHSASFRQHFRDVTEDMDIAGMTFELPLSSDAEPSGN